MPEGDRDSVSFDRFSGALMLLVFGLVLVSVVTYLPEMLDFLLQGESPQPLGTRSKIYLLFRLPREILLVAVLLYLLYWAAVDRRRLFVTPGMVRLVALGGFWALLCALYTLTIKDVPLEALVIGLKLFQPVPLLLAGYVLARRYSRLALSRFADLLRWYVALIVALGLAQTALKPDGDTLFGARSIGPFMNMNAYGATLIACALWFLIARISQDKVLDRGVYGFWIGACAVAAWTTGSRTAIALSSGLVVLAISCRWRGAKRLVGAFVALVVVGTFPFVFSGRNVTGRVVERSNAARLALFRDVVESLETPADWIFGSGLGRSSKSVEAFLGPDHFPGQIGNTDSTYLEVLGGFGIVGLLGLMYLSVALLGKGTSPEAAVFVGIVGLLALPMPLASLFPADALLLFLAGHLVGIGKAEASSSDPPTLDPTPDERASETSRGLGTVLTGSRRAGPGAS